MSDDHPFRSSPGSTSASLIVRAKGRDAEAWRTLWDRYAPLAFAWCRQRGVELPDAADVVQESFTAVSTALARFDHNRPGATFRGWLRAIVQTKIADHYRRATQAQAAGGTDAVRRLSELPEPGETSSAESGAPQDLSALCRRALDTVRLEFEGRTWEAFWRSVIQGQNTAEIAADLGISANAVRQYRSRVLRRLRQELGDEAP